MSCLPDPLLPPRRWWLALVLLLSLVVAVCPADADFYLAPTGRDDAPGTALDPFATLQGAQVALRQWRAAHPGGEAVTVWLQGGFYPLRQTLEITAADSGSAEAPVTWRASQPGTAVLDAGRRVEAREFRQVTEPALLQRMAEEARGQVWELDLARLGIQHAKQPPDYFEDGGGLFDLYCNGERQTLSRWPNAAKTTMERVLERGASGRTPGARGGTFIYRGDRPARWAQAAQENQLWLAGFWRVAWEWATVRVKALDLAARTIELASPVNGGIGSKYAGPEGSGKEPWIALNLLEEIDQPGEWSVDFARQRLYWWPPAPLDHAEIVIADRAEPMVRLVGASHVVLRGLVLQRGLGDGVEVTGGEDCRVEGCLLRELGRTGVVVAGGARHQILSCDLHTLGQSGILIGGGDRKSLTPAGHLVDNNHIHDYGLTKKVYAPGIGVGFRNQPAPAVGCRVTHNLIHHAPHAAVLYGGNDHLFEFNEVHDFLIESDDLGGFYSTYDWTSYGNVVRHNFVHHTPHALGFYLDDGDSGDLIEGNIAYRMAGGVALGGGHDNIARNNLAIECKTGVAIDARGVSRGYATNPTLLKIIAEMKPAEAPWKDRYPSLIALAETLPARPVGSVIERNVTVGCDKLVDLHGNLKDLLVVALRDNVALPAEDLGFTDPAALNFQINPHAAVFDKVPGFQMIPFEKIGLYLNEFRLFLPLHPAGTSKPSWGKD